jgi:hypothetical protein
LSTSRSTGFGAVISLIVLTALTWPLVALGASPQELGSVDLATQASLSIIGAAAGDKTGLRVSGAGDVNGDGRADVVVGASLADTFQTDAGAAYVVFGTGATGNLPLATLGGGGFRIDGGVEGQKAGLVVAGAGDVNGDGRGDVIVASNVAYPNGENSGAAWVVFGKADLAVVHLATLGSSGFQINGAHAQDKAGFAVSGAGDVNGDGLADVVLGAIGASVRGPAAGAAYVVFGKQSSAPVELGALGGQGFEIDGEAADDAAGYSVGGAGDVNLDGRADVVVGAVKADHLRTDSGSAYVVFGRAATTAVDLGSLGSGGYRLDGATAGEQTGTDVAGAGDVNQDGRPDVIVGARLARAGGQAGSGSAYVVWGRPDTAGLDLGALGAGGFRVDGAAVNDQAGWSVSGAGDFNGDRRPDVLVGAYAADNRSLSGAGSAYVVFGKSDTASVKLSALGAAGVQFDGAHTGDEAGQSVSAAGDFNGDRRPDVIIGAPAADDGGAASGTAYVVHGFGDPIPQPACATNCDNDGDGSRTPTDCDDSKAGIHPGALDIPLNGINEDCSLDGDARPPTLKAVVRVDWGWKKHKPWTLLTKLVVDHVVAGSSIRITCATRKRGCPFSSRTEAIKKDAKLYSLTRLFYRKDKHAHLLRKAIVEVRVTKPNYVGKLYRITIHAARTRPATSVQCLVPRPTKTSRCP